MGFTMIFPYNVSFYDEEKEQKKENRSVARFLMLSNESLENLVYPRVLKKLTIDIFVRIWRRGN